MSISFNKFAIVGTATFALLVWASGVSAAPSLGIGRPYYGSTNQGSGGHSFRSYAPAFSTQTRQSFSYEPAQNVAPAPAANGCHSQAVKAPEAVKQDVSKTAPQVTRRSYSYEPAPLPQTQSIRRVEPKRDPWLYPKGDPRRYGR